VVHDWYGNLMLEYRPTDKDDVWADYYDYGFEGDRGGPGSLLGTPELGHYDAGEANFETSNLTFNPNFGYSAGVGFSALGFANGPVAGSVVGAGSITDNPALSNIRNFSKSIPTSIHMRDAWTLNVHWLHHFDAFDVKYVGGYSQYHYSLSEGLYYGDNSSITAYQVPVAPGSYCAKLGASCGPLTVYPAEDLNYHEDNSWFSHELTFSSTGDGPVQWIAGGFYYDQHYHAPSTVALPGQAQIKTPAFGLNVAGAVIATVANPSGDWYLNSYALETRSSAAYGQIDWKLADTLKLTGGLRYTYDQKSGVEDYRVVAFSDFAANPLGFGASAELSAENLGAGLPAIDVTQYSIGAGVLGGSYKGATCPPHLLATGVYERCLGDSSSATTGTAGMEWTPDRDTLAYVRYNRGYKAFGFNAGAITPDPEAAPETVDDVEVGLKQSVGRDFQYNIDVFYYNYMNDQVPVAENNGALVLSEFINIPKAVSDGVELQMIWEPVRRLKLNFTYAFNDTYIVSGCSLAGGIPTGTCFIDVIDPLAQAAGAKPVGGVVAKPPSFPFLVTGDVYQSVKGDALPQAPKHKIALNANYTWVFEPGDLTLSGTFVWKDKSYSGLFTRSYYAAPAWNQVDLRGTWSGDHDRYEVVLYVKNLFDTLGYAAASAATANYTGNPANPTSQSPSFELTPPRTFGVELHYKF
jgi:iron complex outermembrane receptor protein